MQWWCSAQTGAWEWVWQAYPGVWAFVLLLAAVYLFLVRRPGAGAAEGERRASRPRCAGFLAGVFCLWLALDWPIGALGAGYLASAHMVQFLLLALVAPPLLIYGTPPTLLQPLEKRPSVMRPLRVLTHPLVALAFFNVSLVATHWPSVVDSLMPTQLGSFALDMAWLAAGLVLWWPVVAPVPSRPGFSYPYRIGYLILATILNTPAFTFLVFSDLPLYATFELAPPVHGLAARADQRLAGLIMKIGGGLIIWTAITIQFFKWYQAEHAEDEAVA
jgi:cytochrome c oxidase assembly factor CtaG